MPLLSELIKESIAFTVININGERVYIEGVKKLISVSENQVALETKKTFVVVEGELLQIEEIDDGSVTVKGKIIAIRTEKHGK